MKTSRHYTEQEKSKGLLGGIAALIITGLFAMILITVTGCSAPTCPTYQNANHARTVTMEARRYSR